MTLFLHTFTASEFRSRLECPAVLLNKLRSTSPEIAIGVLVCAAVALFSVPVVLAQSEPSSQLPSLNSTSQATVAVRSNPSPAEAPPEYAVGSGDILGVTVYNMPELDRSAVVGSQGSLLLSYFPKALNVTGETARQIGTQVSAELKELQVLIEPQVSVTVIKVESKPVVVGGAIRNPQVLQEIRPFTLQEVLMLSGGPLGDAGNSVLVTRTDPQGNLVSYDLQLSKVMAGTDPNSNIQIEPGDSIQVLPGQKVFVAGAVKAPGAFDLKGDQRLTLAKLMALSGGWKPDADPAKAVIVRQGLNGQRETVPVNLRKIMARKDQDVTLEASDLLYVPGSTGKTVGLAVVKGVGGAAMLGFGYLIVRQ
jgi:polysaccharide biosynthesis/export protein